jgi:hypothetical protein
MTIKNVGHAQSTCCAHPLGAIEGHDLVLPPSDSAQTVLEPLEQLARSRTIAGSGVELAGLTSDLGTRSTPRDRGILAKLLF